MMTLAGQQRPVRVMSNNNAREKSENKHFQKTSLFPLVRNDEKYTFPEVLIFEGATGNRKINIMKSKRKKVFPP